MITDTINHKEEIQNKTWIGSWFNKVATFYIIQCNYVHVLKKDMIMIWNICKNIIHLFVSNK
jgi:hypothetical protein